jgi:hypothetical protein
MKTSYPAAIVLAYSAIMRSNVFRLDGPPIDLPRALALLGRAVHRRETDEFIWTLGESQECSLGDLIVGAYWALTEWHGGQASPSYAALCSLNRVFSPGMARGPEPDSGEAVAFERVNKWFALNPRR